jgi:alanine dehydrogenase
MRLLSDEDVADLLSLEDLLPVVEEAFLRQGRGEVERPERPHFPVGTGLRGEEPHGTGLVGEEPHGTGLTMPAYVYGAPRYATKLVSVHESNPPEQPSVHAQILLTDAATGEPAAFMDGSRVTAARTGCIGGLAARELAARDRDPGPVTLGVLGAGTQARWQTRAIDAAVGVDEVRIYSPSDSRERCAGDLRERGIDARAVDSPRVAVEGTSVVVTATTSREPVFPADALGPGVLVVAVGAYTSEMQELETAVFERAARVFADVPGEVAEIGDVKAADLEEAGLVPLSAVFEDRSGREDDDDILVVESVGTAVLDAATAEYVYGRAVEADVGTEFNL